MNRNRTRIAVCGLLSTLACASRENTETLVLREYPITGVLDVITQDVTRIDTAVSSDGNGAVRIDVAAPTTIRLYETGDLDVEDARLIYRAKLRAQDVQGQAYLELWCSFPGKGEFFSRALHAPITGTVDWTTQEAPFLLQKGENPDNVKLNVVIDGSGTLWIDDIRLARGPLGK